MLEGKLKEFERSLQKLKDCTYQEATQKREYERRVQAAQADLRGSHLREQVPLFLTPGLPVCIEASLMMPIGLEVLFIVYVVAWVFLCVKVYPDTARCALVRHRSIWLLRNKLSNHAANACYIDRTLNMVYLPSLISQQRRRYLQFHRGPCWCLASCQASLAEISIQDQFRWCHAAITCSHTNACVCFAGATASNGA